MRKRGGNQRKGLFLLFLIVGITPLWGQKNPHHSNPAMEGILIFDASDSGQSLILDRGSLEGLEIGQVAELYHSSPLGQGRREYIPVAEGEAIKVHRSYSFWFLYKIHRADLIKKGNRLLMFRQAMDSRRPYRNRHTQKVHSENHEKKNTSKSLEFKEEDLTFKGEDFWPLDLDVTTELPRHEDMATKNQTRWKKMKHDEFDEKNKDLRPVFFVEPAEVPKTLAELKGRREKHVWKSTTKRSIERAKKVPLDLWGKSEAKEHLPVSGALKKIEKEGIHFSSEMDEEQLRHFFVKSGIEEEIKKQRAALWKKRGGEIGLSYYSTLSKNTTPVDRYHTEISYSFCFDYEYHLGNATSSWESFALLGGFETGEGFYNLKSVNARFQEKNLNLFGHWYFLHSPDLLNHFMPYVGLGLRWGQADVTNPTFNRVDKNYSYLLLSFPNYRLGAKYRFKAGDGQNETLGVGMGLNFQIQYENLGFETNEVLQDDIWGKIKLNQIRIALGLNIYF